MVSVKVLSGKLVVLLLATGLVGLVLADHEPGHHDHTDHEDHRVQVDVYYESLCPDSIKFFTKQLYPSLQGNLSSFVTLALIPYGKSTHTTNFNQYEFTCHHGARECKGNQIQACALNLIDGGRNTAHLGFNRNTVGFINCLMDKVDRDDANKPFPTKECAELNNVNNLSQVDNCANHADGSKYLADLGTQTQALKPALTSVPTVVFNRTYKKDDSQMAQENFVKALCMYIEHDKPAECSRNGAMGRHAGATLEIVLGVLVFVGITKIMY